MNGMHTFRLSTYPISKMTKSVIIVWIVIFLIVFRFFQFKDLLIVNLGLTEFNQRVKYESLQVFKEAQIEDTFLDSSIFFDHALNRNIQNETLWLSAGIIYSLQGDDSRAFHFWGKLDNRSIFVMLAKAYEQAQQWDETQNLYDYALLTRYDGNIGVSNIYYQIGYMHQFLIVPENLEAAKNAYLQAINQADYTVGWQEAALYQFLGHIYKRQKQYSEAVSYYKLALQLDPDQYWTYLNYASVLWNLGEQEKTIDLVIRAIDLNPKEKTAFLNLARYYKEIGQIDKAIDAYLEVLKIDPTDSEANQKIIELSRINSD